MKLTKEECNEYLETLKNLVCIQTSCCMQTRAEIEGDKKLFSECINYFENLIKEHFDNPLFPHCKRLMERVTAQSECIEELNDQLSRYCKWEMEQLQMRQNPPLKQCEIEMSLSDSINNTKTIYDNDDKCYIKLFINCKGTIDFFYFGNECERPFVFKEGRFFAREVKE